MFSITITMKDSMLERRPASVNRWMPRVLRNSALGSGARSWMFPLSTTPASPQHIHCSDALILDSHDDRCRALHVCVEDDVQRTGGKDELEHFAC